MNASERVSIRTGEVVPAPSFAATDVTGWDPQDVADMIEDDDAEMEAWKASTVPAPTTTFVPACPDWCTASEADHDEWDREWDGHLHRAHVAELGAVEVTGTPYRSATVAVSLVADDLIEFVPGAETPHLAGVPPWGIGWADSGFGGCCAA